MKNELFFDFSFTNCVWVTMQFVVLRELMLCCAPLGNILNNTIFTESIKSPPTLKKSENCTGSNMGLVRSGCKVSKCDQK